jgi:hypothetical protein
VSLTQRKVPVHLAAGLGVDQRVEEHQQITGGLGEWYRSFNDIERFLQTTQKVERFTAAQHRIRKRPVISGRAGQRHSALSGHERLRQSPGGCVACFIERAMRQQISECAIEFRLPTLGEPAHTQVLNQWAKAGDATVK